MFNKNIDTVCLSRIQIVCQGYRLFVKDTVCLSRIHLSEIDLFCFRRLFEDYLTRYCKLYYVHNELYYVYNELYYVHNELCYVCNKLYYVYNKLYYL